MSIGHPSAHQPPRTPPSADPRCGRSPLAPRIRHVDVSAQPNHVFKGQFLRQCVEQLAIRKAPIRHDRDLHPRRQYLPQPAQHFVLVAALVALQGRRRHGLPQQGRRAPVACQHRQHNSVLPVRGKARPIQRDDYFLASTNNVRRPIGEESPDINPSIAQEPIHLFHTMLGQRAHGLGQATPHRMDRQRRTRQHAQGGIGQRQHPFGMQIALVQGGYEVQKIVSLEQSVARCWRLLM